MNIIIHLICAARPNFMKIAPLYHALAKQQWATPVIIHTGQHYDINMSDAFFVDLGLPQPDIHLEVGSGSHAEQTGNVMIEYEKIVVKEQPDLVVVVGDVNSTIACTLAAIKVTYQMGSVDDPTKIKRPIVAHLEAGLRSFDRSMPEEINRLATDVLVDYLWTPSVDGDENLIKEGIPAHKIQRVGNIMIDSLEMMRSKIESENTVGEIGVTPGNYAVITLHRPANVDNPQTLDRLCSMLHSISKKIPLVFPVHPRTRNHLIRNGLMDGLDNNKNIYLSEPLSYVKFMNLLFSSKLAITDSGGLQEETTHLGIPCLTIRPNTERPITVTQGTNKLCKLDDVDSLVEDVINNDDVGSRNQIDLWDGKTASRIVGAIKNIFSIND